jgi:hypothetical protein
MLVPFPERVPGKQGEIPRPLGPKRRQRLRFPGLALGVLIPFIKPMQDQYHRTIQTHAAGPQAQGKVFLLGNPIINRLHLRSSWPVPTTSAGP